MKKSIDGISRSDTLRELSKAKKEIKKLKKENRVLRESIEEYVSDIEGIADTAMEHFNDFVKTSQLSYLKSTLEDAIYREVYRVKDDVAEKLGLQDHSCE